MKKKLGAVSDNFEFNTQLDKYIEKLIDQFKVNKVSYARRGPVELIQRNWVTKLSASLEKVVTTSSDQIKVNDSANDRQIKVLIAKCMNFAPIQAKLSGLREKINLNPLAATALEYLDISTYDSEIEWKSVVYHTRDCFTISNYLINGGNISDKELNKLEIPGLKYTLKRFADGLLELLCKLPPDNEFDDLHQELLDKYIQTGTLISYLSSLKFGV